MRLALIAGTTAVYPVSSSSVSVALKRNTAPDAVAVLWCSPGAAVKVAAQVVEASGRRVGMVDVPLESQWMAAPLAPGSNTVTFSSGSRLLLWR